MLKDSFYTIIHLDKTADLIRAQLKINPEHKVFEGHFPGMPVTPGVLQLEIIKEVLAEVFEKPVSLKNMSTCKFLAILNPNEVGPLDMQIKFIGREDEILRTTILLKDDQNTYLKVSADYSL